MQFVSLAVASSVNRGNGGERRASVDDASGEGYYSMMLIVVVHIGSLTELQRARLGEMHMSAVERIVVKNTARGKEGPDAEDGQPCFTHRVLRLPLADCHYYCCC